MCYALPENMGLHSQALEYFCRYLAGLPSLHTFMTFRYTMNTDD